MSGRAAAGAVELKSMAVIFLPPASAMIICPPYPPMPERIANRLGNPFSMAFTLMYTIALGHFRGDYTDIRLRAEALEQIARENGFPY